MLIKWKVVTINGTKTFKAIEMFYTIIVIGDFTTIMWVNLPNPLNWGIFLYINYTPPPKKKPTLQHFKGDETPVF